MEFEESMVIRMSKKKKETMELRYYDIPQKEYVLALLGENWIREYGNGIKNLHFHNMVEIGYCRNGKGTMQFDDEVKPYAPAMLSIIPKNFPHTTNSEEGKKSYWEYLFFNPETILRNMYPEDELHQKKILSLINRRANFIHAQDNQQLVSIVLTIMEEMRSKKEFYVDTVNSLTCALLPEIARMNSVEHENLSKTRKPGVGQIKNALEYISREYRQDIKIQELARKCCMSETHFRRLFVEYMNVTPVEYINMVRVQMACEMMKKTNASMEEVAIKSGFSTTSTLNRNFKRIIGTTPYQWKKNPENYESKLISVHVSVEKGW